MLAELAESCNCKPDAIMICESWLTEKKYKRFDIPGYNMYEKHRTTLKGGGVALYIKDNLICKERDDLSHFNEGIYESVFIEISSNKRQNIIVGEVYRPPGISKKDFLVKHEEVLKKITRERKTVVFGADQNIDLFKSAAANFIELNSDHGMIHTIKKQATRVASTSRSTSSTLIDNIYLSTNGFPNARSTVLKCRISDHFPILLCHN